MRPGPRGVAVLLALALLALLLLLLLTREPAGGPPGARDLIVGPGDRDGMDEGVAAATVRVFSEFVPPDSPGGGQGDPAGSPPAPATPPPPPPPAPPPEDPADPLAPLLPARLAGRVLDDATAAPVPGARVLLAWEDEDGLNWHGDWTGADGAFAFLPREHLKGRPPEEVAALRLEIRIRAPGYRDLRVGALDLRGDVRLVPDPTPPLPGLVQGTAMGHDGRPWSGRLTVEAFDRDFGAYFCQWCRAGEDGSYRLEGVPPGNWRMRVSGAGTLQEVRVPEGGDVWVNLAVPEGGPLAAKRDRSFAGEREVRVTGLPGGKYRREFLRCERRPGHFFREPFTGGTCVFDAVPVGPWSLVLEVPGREEVRREIGVAPDEGPLEVRWE